MKYSIVECDNCGEQFIPVMGNTTCPIVDMKDIVKMKGITMQNGVIKMKQTHTIIGICIICIICTIILTMGCLESGYEQSNTHVYTEEVSLRHRPHDVSTICQSSQSTQHVSGIEVTTTLNNVGTLHVSGIDNTVTVTNPNVERIYLSGVDNILYIPVSSDPYISQSGVNCIVKRY